MGRAIARWTRRGSRLARLATASGVATAVDTAVLLLLVAGAGLAPGPAAVVGCLAGGAVNFAVSRRWVFRAHARRWWPQALRYGVIVVGGGALVSGLAVAALTAVGAPLLLAKAVAIVTTMTAWTYPMAARVVFAPQVDHAVTPSAAPSGAVA